MLSFCCSAIQIGLYSLKRKVIVAFKLNKNNLFSPCSRFQEKAMIYLSHTKPLRKSCVHALLCANDAKIVHSWDAQCNSEESPLYDR